MTAPSDLTADAPRGIDDSSDAGRGADVVPFVLLASGLAIALVVAGAAEATDPVWRILLVATGAVGAVLAWRRNRIPRIVLAALVLTVLRMGVAPTGGRAAGELPGRWQLLATTVAGASMVAAISYVHVRRRRDLTHDLVDAVVVLVASGLVAWLMIIEPTLDEGADPLSAILVAGLLPAVSAIIVVAIDLLLGGLLRNGAMLLITGAATVTLTMTVADALARSGVVGHASPAVHAGGQIAALMLLAGALVRRDFPAILKRAPRQTAGRSHTATRLALMTTSMMLPAAAMTLVPESPGVDQYVRLTGTVLLIGLVGLRLYLSMRDHVRAEAVLLGLLHHDELTGLPTRARVVEHLDELLDENWHTEQRLTVVQLNLDRFKNINDSLGHADANAVLRTVAERLRECAADIDGMAARVGGDDFVIVDASTSSVAEATERVERMRRALNAPIRVGDTSVFVTASIGVAFAPRSNTITPEELLRRADMATHSAKIEGRNRVSVFDDSMQAELSRRMDVEHALHGAIGRDELELYHQPILDIVTGRLSGFEALMRWRRTDGGLISPVDFIPIAEETGIIRDLGAWALGDALTALRTWIDQGIVPPTTTMSVNVSPRQVADHDFAEIVRDALAAAGIPPQLLWLEMTESMMLEEPELAQTTLREIRAMGVQLALDDFGTGFSSLSLLQNFPIQRIKIDRAFVRGVADRGNDRSLVRTIIAMAQSMGLDLVAEGVETAPQLRALRGLGCDKAQGYLLSRPVPPDAMRSTMTGLSELGELSLFSEAVPVSDDAIDGSADHDPTLAPEPEPAIPTFASPHGALGSPSRQPLGISAR